jgi:hypothetical protein
MNDTLIRAGLAGALALAHGYASACASCGCTLSSDWDSQGFATRPGLRFDLRYDYLNQSELRTGTGKVDRSGISFPAEREIEQGTANRYLTVGLDYSPNADWGINLQVPYIDRFHTTIAEGDTDTSSSRTNSIGDMRVVARYQGLNDERNVGIQFGLKLPTGDHQRTFSGGPQSGEPLDRGLQPGSGTTDLLLGLYHFGSLNRDWDYFAQGLVQIAMNSKDEYKPGSSLNLNAGVRYAAFENVIPQFQVNVRYVRPDSGADADTFNSGGTVAYLSPGATINATKNVKAFGFLQVPVYQNLHGFQLAPRWTVSVGLRYEL